MEGEGEFEDSMLREMVTFFLLLRFHLHSCDSTIVPHLDFIVPPSDQNFMII